MERERGQGKGRPRVLNSAIDKIGREIVGALPFNLKKSQTAREFE